MKNTSRALLTFLSIVFISCISFSADVKPEVYSATAVYTSGRAQTIPIKIYISSYTTDEEVTQLANILKTEGSDALLKAIDKMDRGKLAPVGKTGTNVGVVRSKSTETGSVVTMVMDRPQAFIELWRSARSTDYPFGILQMTLDKDGKGEGQLMVAAKIGFTTDNTIEVESYGIQPMKLMSIRKLN